MENFFVSYLSAIIVAWASCFSFLGISFPAWKMKSSHCRGSLCKILLQHWMHKYSKFIYILKSYTKYLEINREVIIERKSTDINRDWDPWLGRRVQLWWMVHLWPSDENMGIPVLHRDWNISCLPKASSQNSLVRLFPRLW